jgi:sucrose phosphorylase
MFDAVINHISSESDWFQGFLRDDPRYRDYFIVVEGSPNLARVVRPRVLPLLTTFATAAGEKRVWTTFSADQVDLNFKNPEVLLDILDVLLMKLTTKVWLQKFFVCALPIL